MEIRGSGFDSRLSTSSKPGYAISHFCFENLSPLTLLPWRLRISFEWYTVCTQYSLKGKHWHEHDEIPWHWLQYRGRSTASYINLAGVGEVVGFCMMTKSENPHRSETRRQPSLCEPRSSGAPFLMWTHTTEAYIPQSWASYPKNLVAVCRTKGGLTPKTLLAAQPHTFATSNIVQD